MKSNSSEQEILAALELDILNRGLTIVAQELGYSKTSISLLRKGKYTAKPRKIIEHLRQHYAMRKTIICPIFGEISPDDCHRSATFAHYEGRMMSNPEVLREWARCRICPHNHITTQKEQENGNGTKPHGCLYSGSDNRHSDVRNGTDSHQATDKKEDKMALKRPTRQTPRSINTAVAQKIEQDQEQEAKRQAQITKLRQSAKQNRKPRTKKEQ